MKKIYLAIFLFLLVIVSLFQSPESKETILKNVRKNYFCNKKEVKEIQFCGEYIKTITLDSGNHYYKKYIEIRCPQDSEIVIQDCQTILTQKCEAKIECTKE